MKISAILVTHNEAELLKDWLPSAAKWADEIIICLHDCSDNSVSVINDFPGNEKVKVVDMGEDAIAAHGFSYPKNRLAEEASGDWIVSLDTDEEMDFTREELEENIRAAGDMVAIRTQTWAPNLNGVPDPSKLTREELKKRMFFAEKHWRIYKNRVGVQWAGMIHEALHYAGSHIDSFAYVSTMRMLHFGGAVAHLKDRTHSNRLYSELICRAFDNPELRSGTNNWWFDVFYYQNMVKLRDSQREFWEARGNRPLSTDK